MAAPVANRNAWSWRRALGAAPAAEPARLGVEERGRVGGLQARGPVGESLGEVRGAEGGEAFGERGEGGVEERVGEGVLPPEREHVPPAGAPLLRAAHARPVRALHEAVAVEVAGAHPVELPPDRRVESRHPFGRAARGEKVGEAVQARRAGHEVLVFGQVAAALVDEPAARVARRVLQPALQRRAEQFVGGEAGEHVAEARRGGGPHVQADRAVHGGAVVAERRRVRTVGEGGERAPLHGERHLGGRVAAQRHREAGEAQAHGALEAPGGQQVVAFGLRDLADLDLQPRAVFVPHHVRAEQHVALGLDAERSVAGHVEPRGGGDEPRLTRLHERSDDVRRRHARVERERPRAARDRAEGRVGFADNMEGEAVCFHRPA